MSALGGLARGSDTVRSSRGASPDAERRGARTMRPLLTAASKVAAVLASLLFALCVGEVALRIYHHRTYGIDFLSDANHGLLSKDATLGWKMSPNLSYATRARDALNKTYAVEVRTDQRGFRQYGNPRADKTRLLVIGDSFTAALDVSNDKTYYGVMKAALPDVELFAYGAGGYGSLQEFMLLDEQIDAIRPDLIVWQFYENDFLDNDVGLDMLKSLYNTGMPRPYLGQDGGVTYRYATYGALFFPLPAPIAENTRLLKLLNARLAVLANRLSRRAPVSEQIARQGAAHAGFQRAESTTRRIMEKVRQRAGATPVYLFPLTDRQPYHEAIRTICQAVGIRFVDSVTQGLREQESRIPKSTRAADGEHLNETGNRIVAETLIRYLREQGALPKEPPRAGNVDLD